MSLETFTEFVNTELPVRAAMLTYARCAYDGDPNGGGAPAMVSAAPIGTMYLRQTGNILYQKTSPSAGTWQLVGGSSIITSGLDTFPSGVLEYEVASIGATTSSKIIISWFEDHGATRSWVVRGSNKFTVHLASAAAVASPFVWEIL